MAFTCHKCGAAATKRCSRCKAVYYCSPACQVGDWGMHKRADCPLLPASFQELPQSHVHCLHCGHHFLMCDCKEDMAPHENMIFVLPKVPPHYTFSQRVRRWARLMAAHPQLRSYDADQYLDDILPNLEQDMTILRPIITQQMEGYRRTGLTEVCVNLGIPDTGDRRAAAMVEMRGECDHVMEKFFAGDWALPTRIEYVFLYNAIQMTGPEDFDTDTARRFERVLDPVSFIADVYKTTWPGVHSYAFRLEDEENFRR
jgi:MYND finger